MSSEKQENENRSIRRTKRILKEKFIELIIEKGYRNVSVTDIVERADYNRSTFYFYFQDKEELINQIIEQKMEELEYSFDFPFKNIGDVEIKELVPKSMIFFKHIYEQEQFYNLLVIEDSIPGLDEKFILKIRSLFEKLNFKSKTKMDSYTEQHKIFMTYGIFGMILEWIKSGYELSAEDLAEKLHEVFTTSFQTVGLTK
ncbi:TetR/AcrR family transcriptional regulator [Psychrobacillus soli]|uniref:TetR/AcrR family transcriptional regulator n=1 Tax=Psychrobacillus soli TaxID=1543965 RepID=A0A544T0M2_9BACI|nr:TetR/AcrR family transcriptional regulator [Psychrobacillus soli]TQR10991.1 TetR/AcrR family transcriptional regulator [Psychrobacillus soli]